MAKRGENIRKRKDGRWEGRYIKGRKSDGKSAWGYLYGHSYTEVKQELTRRKALSGFYQLSNSSLRFWELAELWLASIAQSVKVSTLAHYRYTLRKYLLPVLGGLSVSSLNEATLERLFLSIISPGDNSHKPLGASSSQECLGMLRRICKYGTHLHLLPPLELCIRLPQTKRAETKPLTLAEQNKLRCFLLDSPTPRKIGVLLQMELGLRIGEVCGLQWRDFDLEAGALLIRRTVCRVCCGNGHTKLIVQSPKTKNSARVIPLPKQLVRLLSELRKSFAPDVWFLSGSASRLVEPRCYRKSIHGYLKRASLRSIHPHALRHTFATTCLQTGCDIKTLSELLGHANANVTLQRYVHADLNRRRKELQRIYTANEKIYKESLRGKPQRQTA